MDLSPGLQRMRSQLPAGPCRTTAGLIYTTEFISSADVFNFTFVPQYLVLGAPMTTFLFLIISGLLWMLIGRGSWHLMDIIMVILWCLIPLVT